jgi:hypothetical protein
MSGIDRASVVGRPVWPEGDDTTDYNRTIFAYLGETDGTHYYSVQDVSGVKIYPADSLRVMRADGLGPLFEDAEAPSVSDSNALAGTEVHPFEQLGRAGDGPAASVQLGGQTAVPVFDGRAGMTAADAANRDRAALGPDRAEREVRALETLNDPLINQQLQAGDAAFPPATGGDPSDVFAADADKTADIPGATAPGDSPAPRVPKEDTTASDTSTNGGNSPTSGETSGDSSGVVGGTVDPADAPGTPAYDAKNGTDLAAPPASRSGKLGAKGKK